MTPHEIMKKYLGFLETADYDGVMSLFTPDAIAHSPLYGDIDVQTFYKDLFEDTNKSVLTFKETFTNKDASQGAINFQYEWTMADGAHVSFNCVDIFTFSKNSDLKIKDITIVYDTAQTRQKFNNLKA